MKSRGRFSIYCHADLIGWSDLEGVDWPMGYVFGRFVPAPAYSNEQAAIRAASNVPDRVAAQTALALSVRTPDGEELLVSGGICINDQSSEFGPEGIEIELFAVDNLDAHFPEGAAQYERRSRGDA
jgi:hypothetical protein